jgi:hypothetical protein
MIHFQQRQRRVNEGRTIFAQLIDREFRRCVADPANTRACRGIKHSIRGDLTPELIDFTLVFAFDEQRDRFIEAALRRPFRAWNF